MGREFICYENYTYTVITNISPKMATHTSKFEVMPLMEKDEDWEDPDDLVLGPLNSVLENMKYNSRTVSRSEFCNAILFASTLSFVAGVTVPYIFYSLLFHHCSTDISHMKISDSISPNLLSEIKESRIKLHQIKLQEVNSSVLPFHIKEQWEKQGLDKVSIVSHSVVVSLPSKNILSKLHVIKKEEEGEQSGGSPLTTNENSNYIKPLCCASGIATSHPIEGDLVFANFGRFEDFLQLSKLNVNISGNIAVMKYDVIPTHNKILLAQKLGAKGVILFPSIPSGFRNSDITNMSCNILLPEETKHFCPSLDQFLFQKMNRPTIPVFPVKNEDAEELLRKLGGPKEPDEWTSGESSHNVGPGFAEKNRKVRIELYVEDVNQTAYSTIGKLQGEIESDRSVVVGSTSSGKNSTGLSILLEISQVFTKFLKDGIRPRRNILFCAWGSGSYFVTQSINEWIKDHMEYLEEEVIAYLDVSASPAEIYHFISTPMLQKEIAETVHKVLDHREHDMNIFSALQPNSTLNDQGKGRFHHKFVRENMAFHNILGAQSAYLQHECIPQTSCQYVTECNSNCCASDALEDFHHLATLAQIWASIIDSLSHSQLLHFDVGGLATYLSNSIKDLQDKYGKLLEENSALLSKLNDSIEEFAKTADYFDKKIKNIDGKNSYAVRSANDKLVRIGRSFADKDCSSKRSSRRNVLLAPSSVIPCIMVAFPEVTDLLLLLGTDNSAEHIQINEDFQNKTSVIISHLKSATRVLNSDIFDKVGKK